jgi:predicted RNA-binding protein with PIN domain
MGNDVDGEARDRPVTGSAGAVSDAVPGSGAEPVASDVPEASELLDTSESLEAADQEPAPRLIAPLPEPIRVRVLALASETAGLLPAQQVPTALRPFAKFTPPKRAKLAAIPLAAAVEADEVFRGRIAERVTATFPEVVAALREGIVPPAADPRDVAALAYLVRPDGWPDLVEEAAHAAHAAERTLADEHLGDELARLKAELDAARETAKYEVERIRAELVAERHEGDSLRRQIRRLEADMRRAQAQARTAEAALLGARTEATAGASQAEAELRRVRARLADAEAAVEGTRRSARESRVAGEVRLRLLLETITEAATGLRRELALAPTEQRPADLVDAIRPAAMSTADVAGQARAHDDPATLEALLALPKAHLVIDGYNVTKTGYPTLSLNEQRIRLLRGLGALAARTGVEVTCVFDGAELGAPVPVPQHKGVRVLFSRPGETADELIRRLVAAEPPGRPIVVVSTDREVADGVRRSGARPVPSAMLVRALGRS